MHHAEEGIRVPLHQGLHLVRSHKGEGAAHSCNDGPQDSGIKLLCLHQGKPSVTRVSDGGLQHRMSGAACGTADMLRALFCLPAEAGQAFRRQAPSSSARSWCTQAGLQSR